MLSNQKSWAADYKSKHKSKEACAIKVHWYHHESSGTTKWDVQFDFNVIIQKGVSSTSLQIVEADVRITLDKISNMNNNSTEQVSS